MNVERKTLTKRKNLPKGLAALEVVIATGIMIPSLVLMLWLGMKMMAAFFSLFGTMAGSAIS
ncbi:MAG: hypothetical protein ACK449_19350 [Planctomycetota bacterium]|jgi:hypothetical protein